MCVHCLMHRPGRWWIKTGGWSITNLWPRLRRGEGNPPPTIMAQAGPIGIQLEFDPFRIFRGYRRFRDRSGKKSSGFRLGPLVIAWKGE